MDWFLNMFVCVSVSCQAEPSDACVYFPAFFFTVHIAATMLFCCSRYSAYFLCLTSRYVLCVSAIITTMSRVITFLLFSSNYSFHTVMQLARWRSRSLASALRFHWKAQGYSSKIRFDLSGHRKWLSGGRARRRRRCCCLRNQFSNRFPLFFRPYSLILSWVHMYACSCSTPTSRKSYPHFFVCFVASFSPSTLFAVTLLIYVQPLARASPFRFASPALPVISCDAKHEYFISGSKISFNRKLILLESMSLYLSCSLRKESKNISILLQAVISCRSVGCW